MADKDGMAKVRANFYGIGRGARGGFALLVVLFVVMAITILSLGFLARSNTELTAGNNYLMRTGLDNLVISGFEQAKTLIVNGYDVGGGYAWPGATKQQITTGNDYYDVTVSQLSSAKSATYLCSYLVRCQAYRLKNGEKVGICDANAVLRFDPAIACWFGTGTGAWSRAWVYGDVYCNGNFTGAARVTGDVWAAGTVDAKPTRGQSYAGSAAPVRFPDVNATDIVPDYYYYDFDSKSVAYCGSVENIDHNNPVFGTPVGSNKAGVYYCDANTVLTGDIAINGTLAVKGDLIIRNAAVTITASRNFPALEVSGMLKIGGNTTLNVTGLTYVYEKITVDANAVNTTANFYGMVATAKGAIETPTTTSVTLKVYAYPAAARIMYWPDGVDGSDPNTGAFRYTPAPVGYYKDVRRNLIN